LKRRLAALLGGAVFLTIFIYARPAGAQEGLVPPFDTTYTIVNMGAVPGVPPPYGGLTLRSDDPNTLLIGGSANSQSGTLYAVRVIRDAQNHIVGFSGTAMPFAAAEYNDGGVTYGPNDALFLARWPVNELGQIKAGSTVTDKVISLAAIGVGGGGPGGLTFVPPGFGGAGQLKIVTWPAGQFYTLDCAPDGSGTFNIPAARLEATIGGGPEGFAYVRAGSPHITADSMVVSEWSAGRVAVYEIDANGNPVVSTRREMVTGLTGAEGAFIDPLTGDYLFSTFGGFNRVVVVRGFARPQPTLNNVRVIDRISTANIVVDQASFTIPPFSVEAVGEDTAIEWRFDRFTLGQVTDLAFDVTLKNPVPGEDRVVIHNLELVYTGSNGQPVRTMLGSQTVHVLASAFSTAVTTSKPQYTANDAVPITVAVTNLSEVARTVDVSVLVEDGQGVPVRTVTTLTGQPFAVGEAKTFDIVGFNTGRTPAGDYGARARLLDAGRLVGEATAAFTIQSVRQVASTITANKIEYSSNEPVTLTSRITSQSPNATLARLEATVSVLDPTGMPVFSETRAVPDLQPETHVDLKSLTSTGTRPPGLYTVNLAVRSDGAPLTSAITTFRILSSLGQLRVLAGSIDVTPRRIIVGEQTTVTYALQNIGNEIDLPVIRVNILVIDPDTALAVRVITNETALNGREVFSESFPFHSTGLVPKPYLVVLQGTVAGLTQSLASAGLEVKPVPNGAPTAHAGPDRLGLVGQAVTLDGTASSDPDENALAYRWHFTAVPARSQVTDASLIDGAGATPSFVPDAEGTYVLTLVVNDGIVDSAADTVAVFVNPAPMVDVHPETIKLKSHGGVRSVTAVLRSPILSAFAPFTAADGVTVTATFALETRYVDKNGTPVTFLIPATNHPGDDTVVPVDLDDDDDDSHDDDHIDVYQLTLKFDRHLLVAGFRDQAGRFRITDPTAVTFTVIGNGLVVGSDASRVILADGESR
jgi:hypothetical protein